ncbi:SNF2 family N-terminal domain-containing protein [Rhypophila decipiens]|uniref:SNF2 family N-terminal domain-containing protein n=1 Tax=Rhypophila decipiens TaxID=261697 RepID=A0AAN7B2J2_9PEZI|nr:SNF2 family N-terminal domain-containing protein [Rhypophila decipiens]
MSIYIQRRQALRRLPLISTLPRKRDQYANTPSLQYNQIEKALVQLKWFPKSAIGPCSTVIPGADTHDSRSLRLLRLNFHPDKYCLVQSLPEGENVGVLESRAVKYLTDLAIHPIYPIIFEGLVEESVWNEKFTAAFNGSSRPGQSIAIDIDVFGPRHMADEVGRVLGGSGSGIFLQKPARRRLPPYENPQCVRLHYSRDPTVLDHVLPLLHDFEHGPSDTRGQGSTNYIENLTEGPNLDLDQMMDGLRGPGLSGHVQVDVRVITPLMRHQHEGLDFIMKRESLAMPEDRSLWEPLGAQDQVTGYRHAITGAKSRTADDSPGGILADDMGLGKSLTMIAAIIGSLDRAADYASQNGNADLTDAGSISPFLRATLIIVPSELLLANWIEEIEKHTVQNSVQSFKYHGRDRHELLTDLNHIRAQDIVLTTYGTAAADYGKGGGLLMRHSWYRIILDEAHVIRNWSTRQFAAVQAIPAHIRWCVTGTPIQNRLEDLGALVRFLQVPVLKDVAIFRRYICYSPDSQKAEVKRSSKISLQDSLSNLRLMLGSICLRRAQGILPFRFTKQVLRPRFTEEEEHEYQALARYTKQALIDAVASESAKASHTHVLEQLLRLREFCNGISPRSGRGGGDTTTGSNPESMFEMMVQEQQQMTANGGHSVGPGISCEYCSVEVASLDDGAILTECRRIVCKDAACTSGYWRRISSPNDGVVTDLTSSRCPFQVCSLQHRSYNLLDTTAGEQAAPRRTVKKYPTKLLRLLEDVQIHAPQTKSIIFSVWKRTLDLVELLLEEHGIKYCRVDGSVSTVKQRKEILKTFQMEDNFRVLLMTLGTGAVGLNNLSVASRIYILEPQWNPSVERQAIGRLVRLGQEKEVHIIRFIMRTQYSIEETVERCQERKLKLFADEGGVNIAQAVMNDWAI